MKIRPVRVDEWGELRDLRLRALEEAPGAFEATAERERMHRDAFWQARARGWRGPGSITFVAEDAGRLVGMAVGVNDGASARLGAMWVEPGLRGRGVGGRLVDAVLAWARAQGAECARLGVVDGNEAALALYRAAKFTATGVVEEIDRGLLEIELTRTL